MSTSIAIVAGTLLPDGTLELEEKVHLPAGKVQVTLIPMPTLPQDDPFWELMQNIWAGQRSRGHVPRSAEEVDAERHLVRREWDERMAKIRRTQQEAEGLRGEEPSR